MNDIACQMVVERRREEGVQCRIHGGNRCLWKGSAASTDRTPCMHIGCRETIEQGVGILWAAFDRPDGVRATAPSEDTAREGQGESFGFAAIAQDNFAHGRLEIGDDPFGLLCVDTPGENVRRHEAGADAACRGKEVGNRLVVDDVCLDNVVLSAGQRRALGVQVDLQPVAGRVRG